MGLDFVEFVIRTEDAFGIKITDKEASLLRTPRDVIDLVASKAGTRQNPLCLSQAAFHLFRKEALAHTGVPRAAIRPSATLEELIPENNRRVIWSALKSGIGAKDWPALCRPTWLRLSLITISVLTFSFCLVIFIGGMSIATSIVLALSSMGGATYFGFFLTRPLQTGFPPNCGNVADISKYLAIHSPHVLLKSTREQIAEIVNSLIQQEFGIQNFAEDSRFVEDMKLD
jgi:acyl carrier protein